MNAQSRVLEEMLDALGHPLPRLSAALRFYDRKEIKDVLAYLRADCQPQPTTSALRADHQHAQARHRRCHRGAGCEQAAAREAAGAHGF